MCGVGSLVYDSGAVVEIKPSGCRSWGCEVCAPIRKTALGIRLELGRPNRFLTLTCRPRAGETPGQRRKRMGEAFPLLMRRIHRKTGVKPEYGVIVEATQKGEPHFHVALRCAFISKSLLKKWWHELTGAFIVDIKAVTNTKGSAKYLTKYMGKELHRFGTAKRYWFSKGYVLPPAEGSWLQEPDRTRWHWIKDDIETVEWSYRHLGWWKVPGEGRADIRHLMWRLREDRKKYPGPMEKPYCWNKAEEKGRVPAPHP